MGSTANTVWLATSALTLFACRGGGEAAALHAHGRRARWGDEGKSGSHRLPAVAEKSATQGGGSAPAWDWNGVIGTGQSLAVGAHGGTPILTSQAFHNLKLDVGRAHLGMPPYDPNDPSLSMVPLVEPIRPEATTFPSAYPSNVYGETPHTAMADQISLLYRRDVGADYVTVHTVVGESGQGIGFIDKSATATPTVGHAYAATLFEVAALKRLAAAAGKTYGVAAIVLTHGETDAHRDQYEDEVARLHRDYNADIAAITGQTRKIPILFTQQQTSPPDHSMPASLLAQWYLELDDPGQFICAGPKYQYPYAPDHLHLLARGYDWLGEKYGEVYYETIVLGHDWEPLRPIAIRRTGREIIVDFHVPRPPLAWDENLPEPHQRAHRAWVRGRGFEVEGRSGEETIAAVRIEQNSVIVVLAGEPSTTELVVRYAITQDGEGTLGGLATGRIGQLRDSDSAVGFATGLPLYNYAVSFAAPVN